MGGRERGPGARHKATTTRVESDETGSASTPHTRLCGLVVGHPYPKPLWASGYALRPRLALTPTALDLGTPDPLERGREEGAREGPPRRGLHANGRGLDLRLREAWCASNTAVGRSVVGRSVSPRSGDYSCALGPGCVLGAGGANDAVRSPSASAAPGRRVHLHRPP